MFGAFTRDYDPALSKPKLGQPSLGKEQWQLPLGSPQAPAPCVKDHKNVSGAYPNIHQRSPQMFSPHEFKQTTPFEFTKTRQLQPQLQPRFSSTSLVVRPLARPRADVGSSFVISQSKGVSEQPLKKSRPFLGDSASEVPGGSCVASKMLTESSDKKSEISSKIIEPVTKDASLFPDLPADKDINLEDIIFDCRYYYEKYPDVRVECGDDQEKLRRHWKTIGIDEGRMCSPVLDLSFFITRIPKEFQTRQLTFSSAYTFFLRNVSNPKRAQLASSKLYDPVIYVKRYPQLEKYSPKQLIYHFISIGRFHHFNASA